MSFCRVAVKAWVAPPVARLAVCGDTLTAIGGALTVMVAAADFVESETEVAVRVMAPEGAEAGAVKTTLAPDALIASETLPQEDPEQPVPESAQATPLLAVSFVTVAVKFACCPTATDDVAGETETEMGCVSGGGVWRFTVPTEPPPQPTSKNAIVIKLTMPSRQHQSERRSKVILPLKEESAGGRRGIVTP
jgi:hypothetical protein